MCDRGRKMLNVKKYYTSFCKLSCFLSVLLLWFLLKGSGTTIVTDKLATKEVAIYQGHGFYWAASFWGEISLQAQIWKPGKCLRYEAYKVFRWSKSQRALSDDEVLDNLPTSGYATNCWANLLWQLKRQRLIFLLSPWVQEVLHFD